MESHRSSRFSQSTTVVQSPHLLPSSTWPQAVYPITPVLEVDVDPVPFSNNWPIRISEIIRRYNVFQESEQSTLVCRYSNFLIETITNIKDVDPQWDDDEIEEILFISPKIKSPTSTPDVYSSLIKNLPEYDVLKVLHNEPVQILLARNTSNLSMVSVKTLRRRKDMDRKLLKRLCSEQTCLKEITLKNGPFLPRLHRSFENGNRLFMITDAPSSCNLMLHLKQVGLLSPDSCRFYASEIMEALDFLHNNRIVHRDVKPENVEIKRNGHVVLCNFEHAICLSNAGRLNHCSSAECGTQEYQAPEMILGWNYTFSVDCWGFGIILHFMHFGNHPFHYSDELDPLLVMQNRILHSQDSFSPPRLTPLVEWNLIKKCLERNPHLRLTVEQIKHHGYFCGIDWQKVRAKEYEVPFIPGESDECHTHCAMDDRIFHLRDKDCPEEGYNPDELEFFDKEAFDWGPTYSNPCSLGSSSSNTDVEQAECFAGQGNGTGVLKESIQFIPRDIQGSFYHHSILPSCLSLSAKEERPRKLRKKRISNSVNPVRSSTLSNRKSFLSLRGPKRANDVSKNRHAACQSVSGVSAFPEGIVRTGKGIGYNHTPPDSRSRLSLSSIAPKSCFRGLNQVFSNLGRSSDNLPSSRNQFYGSSWSIADSNEARMSTVTFDLPEGLGRRVDSEDQETGIAS